MRTTTLIDSAMKAYRKVGLAPDRAKLEKRLAAAEKNKGQRTYLLYSFQQVVKFSDLLSKAVTAETLTQGLLALSGQATRPRIGTRQLRSLLKGELPGSNEDDLGKEDLEEINFNPVYFMRLWRDKSPNQEVKLLEGKTAILPDLSIQLENPITSSSLFKADPGKKSLVRVSRFDIELSAFGSFKDFNLRIKTKKNKALLFLQDVNFPEYSIVLDKGIPLVIGASSPETYKKMYKGELERKKCLGGDFPHFAFALTYEGEEGLSFLFKLETFNLEIFKKRIPVVGLKIESLASF